MNAVMENDNLEHPPLEKRMVELIFENGTKKNVPALSKHFVPSFQYVTFYLPSVKALEEEPSLLEGWEQQMKIFRDELKWLLRLPHYKFWSVMVYSPQISDQVLTSFLLLAPRNHDPQSKIFLTHAKASSVLNLLYGLVFRIFLRLSTFKENKEDHISPSKWASLIYDNCFFDIPKLIELCILFEPTQKPLLCKMVENVFKHEPRILDGLQIVLPLFVKKWESQGKELEELVKSANAKNQWKGPLFEELLMFNVDAATGLYKLMSVHQEVAEIVHKTSTLEFTLALAYEQDIQIWKRVLGRFSYLESLVNIWRVYMLKLFRILLASSTIFSPQTTDTSVDQFIESLSNCIEMPTFIHDYESTYPLQADMNSLRQKRVYIDPARVNYLGHAMEAAFETCGRRYSFEKFQDSSVAIRLGDAADPLNDPSFDRQLLGACSLEPPSPKLQGLISQVKDVFPDLSDYYVQVCLEHYKNNTEVLINALLESTVPSHLLDAPAVEEQPSTKAEQHTTEVLYRKKDQDVLPNSSVPDHELKHRILELHASQLKPKVNKEEGNYVAENLLPTFNEDIEYDDEYDDTYDEVGVGMTEPDAQPLNVKASRFVAEAEEEEEEPERHAFEHFVEDPAIIRARMEQRRAEKYGRPQHGSRDVKGGAKGQGQSAEVLLNRRKKNEAGSHNQRKRADFKRKEF